MVEDAGAEISARRDELCTVGPQKRKERGYMAALVVYLLAYLQDIRLRGAIVTWLGNLFLGWNERVRGNRGRKGA